MRSLLSIFDIDSLANGVLFTNSFLMPMHLEYNSCFSCQIQHFRIHSEVLNHFDLIFVQIDRCGSYFILPCILTHLLVFPAPFPEDTIFSLVFVFRPLCQIQAGCSNLNSYLDLLFFSLIHMSVFVPVSYWFYYYTSVILLEIFEIWNDNPVLIFFLLRTSLVIQGLLWSHIYFRLLKTSISIKDVVGIFDWDCVEYVN